MKTEFLITSTFTLASLDRFPIAILSSSGIVPRMGLPWTKKLGPLENSPAIRARARLSAFILGAEAEAEAETEAEAEAEEEENK